MADRDAGAKSVGVVVHVVLAELWRLACLEELALFTWHAHAYVYVHMYVRTCVHGYAYVLKSWPFLPRMTH